MTDSEKLAAVRLLMLDWAYLRDRMGEAEFQSDLTKIQYIVYSDVVSKLEKILEN